MKQLRVIIADAGEEIPFMPGFKADTILRRTDVPGVYRVAKSVHTNKAGKLVQIKDWE